MRELTYELSNGTIVRTYAEALASGLTYKARLTKVVELRKPLGPKHEAMRVKI